jgi:DNA-binding response OmpR family regulator
MSSASTSGVQANALLVVDSNHGGFGMLAEVLTRSGYAVHGVANLLAASGSIRDSPPSAILVKLRVYDRSAIKTCSALTAATPELPLMVVGPKIDGREKACMLDAGAADYVEFPFDTDELLARIRSLIRISH